MRLQTIPSPSVFLWVAFLASCASSEDGGTPSSGTLQCRTDNQCNFGSICSRGACVREGSDDLDAGDDVPEDVPECLFASDCPDGWSCVNNACRAPDAGDEPIEEPLADSAVEDSVPDLPVEEVAEDTGAPEPDVPDVPVEEESDECEGREDGVLGDACNGAVDCCNGLCLGSPEAGLGRCTERCATYDECNPPGFLPSPYFCLDVGPDGNFCAPSDYEAACESPDDCLGQVCLKGLGTSGCSWQCDTGVDCPAGAGCGWVDFLVEGGGVSRLRVCAPVGTNCAVDPGSGLNNCLSGVCVTPDEGGLGFCTVFCVTGDPQTCPTGWGCRVVEVGVDPICVPL